MGNKEIVFLTIVGLLPAVVVTIATAYIFGSDPGPEDSASMLGLAAGVLIFGMLYIAILANYSASRNPDTANSTAVPRFFYLLIINSVVGFGGGCVAMLGTMGL